MLHRFEFKGEHIIYDVNSNSIYITDKLISDIVGDVDRGLSKEAIAAKYNSPDLEDIFKEIEILKENNMLFTKEIEFMPRDSDGPYTLKSMCINVSHDCNMRCAYCFADTGTFKNKDRLLASFKTGKKAIDFLIKESKGRKKLDVDFFGGEPMINFSVMKEIIEYMYEEGFKHGKKFKVTVTTNCLEVTDEQAEFFDRYGINLVLSLDGRKEVNDYLRKDTEGGGTYDKITENISKLIKNRNDLSYFVRGTYTKKALDFSEDVKHLAELGYKNISMEPVVLPEGNPLSLDASDMDTIKGEYDKLTDYYLNNPDKFKFFHFNMDLDRSTCIHKRVSGCGAGSEYMAVTPTGDLYPCHQFVGDKDFIIGNINDEEKPIKNEDIRKMLKNTHIYTKDACKSCWAKFICSGGCHANAYFMSGDFNSPYKLGCEIQKKRIECALYIAAKEKEGKMG